MIVVLIIPKMKLFCKFFGHKFPSESAGFACIRCGHDPLATLRDLIEGAHEYSAKDEMRKLLHCDRMEGTFRP